jgi:hypothetical protein
MGLTASLSMFQNKICPKNSIKATNTKFYLNPSCDLDIKHADGQTGMNSLTMRLFYEGIQIQRPHNNGKHGERNAKLIRNVIYSFFLKRHLQSFADFWPTLTGFSIYI